jgi:hypothetical protein
MSNFAATINAAPAYIVNDIYKRFMNPGASDQLQVRLSRIASVAVLLVGISVGLFTTRITDVMMWIVGALYSGYVMANVLKWYWWRFNGYGYFWGMVSGILGAMFVPALTEKVVGHAVNPLYTFPIIFILSTLGCILGTFLGKPEEDSTLVSFYSRVNPWGFWGPIREKVVAANPAFRPNRNFCRDSMNVTVGIVWQLCLTALPIYIVLQKWSWVGGILILLVVLSVFLKWNWYNHLPPAENAPEPEKASSTVTPSASA